MCSQRFHLMFPCLLCMLMTSLLSFPLLYPYMPNCIWQLRYDVDTWLCVATSQDFGIPINSNFHELPFTEQTASTGYHNYAYHILIFFCARETLLRLPDYFSNLAIINNSKHSTFYRGLKPVKVSDEIKQLFQEA